MWTSRKETIRAKSITATCSVTVSHLCSVEKCVFLPPTQSNKQGGEKHLKFVRRLLTSLEPPGEGCGRTLLSHVTLNEPLHRYGAWLGETGTTRCAPASDFPQCRQYKTTQCVDLPQKRTAQAHIGPKRVPMSWPPEASDQSSSCSSQTRRKRKGLRPRAASPSTRSCTCPRVWREGAHSVASALELRVVVKIVQMVRIQLVQLRTHKKA